MTAYVIEPVEIGRRKADSSLFLYLTDPGQEIEIAYRLWLLRSQDGVILIDTGPPLEEAQRRGITQVRGLNKALGEIGVDPTAIQTIVLTHLHWDHASNVGEFPNATFLAQRSEIEFFRSRQRAHPTIDQFFSHHEQLNSLIDQERIRAIHGNTMIAPGLTAIRVGGHTPGSQMLLVETPEGQCVITGDAIPLHRNYIENIPTGIFVDVLDAIAALDHVRALRPIALYTGHDPKPVLRLT